jgi:hypothetical protein
MAPTANSTNNLGFPRYIPIIPFHTAVSHVNWDSIQASANFVRQGRKFSSGAQNDEINFNVVLGPGTWTVEIIHHKAPDVGIYSVQLDGVEKGTIDGYDSGTVRNVYSSVTGIVIGTGGKYQLKLKMATKNGSSSSYIGSISGVYLRRTA